ncbi:hypothetical protein [Desulfospira joergensenii]|uniref:hypothetical protein n=1 Tax=Desulfospira joergensenii TaxID=53329 RepID=UPI0003B6C1E8|nr:hypothetical protein [Desulfospira joergensenii]
MNPLTELKQVIASMESRIEDENVDAFEDQLSLIKARHPDNAAMTSIIEMMRSLGRYLGTRKKNVHEDTFSVLKAITEDLEKLACEPDLDKDQAAGILAESSRTYRALKAKITSLPLISAIEMQDLKEVILAIDWEISNATLEDFDKVTTRLMSKFKSSKIPYSFLKIINSLGRYIASKKALAHQDAIFFLHSVFADFERVVQTPGMPFQEKKRLIERDVAAFIDFKKKLANTGKEATDSADSAETPAVRPALSHVKTSRTHSDQKVVLLETSSQEEAGSPSRPEDSQPGSPKVREREQPENQDIMGDLFSIKESPADKMLDFIHLSGVHGEDQAVGKNMDSLAEEDLKEKGFKNFIPQRRDTDPIPEIRSRLDDFFSQEDVGNPSVAGPGENETPLIAADEAEPLSVQEDDPETFIIFREVEETPGFDPGEKGDSGILVHEKESIPVLGDVVEPLIFFPEGEDPVEEAIKRLKALAESRDLIPGQEMATTVEEDLFMLQDLWREDPDKVLLIDVLFRFTRQALAPEEPEEPEEAEEAEELEELEELSELEESEDPDHPDEPVVAEDKILPVSLDRRRPPGVWKKLKSALFPGKK